MERAVALSLNFVASRATIAAICGEVAALYVSIETRRAEVVAASRNYATISRIFETLKGDVGAAVGGAEAYPAVDETMFAVYAALIA